MAEHADPSPEERSVVGLALIDLGRLALEVLRFLWAGLKLPWTIANLITHTGTRREGLGYLVWGLALLGFAIPEIWASADSHQPWPTLSWTVGQIEQHHDWSAIIVVGILVFGAMHAIRFRRASETAKVAASGTRAAAEGEHGRTLANPTRTLLATPDGRLTRAPRIDYMGWGRYYVFAVLLVAAGYTAPRLAAPSNKELIGSSLYGSIGLALFVIPSWLAYRIGRVVPFPPLFQTFRDIERHARWFAVIVAAGLTVLMIHLVFYPWTAILPNLQHLHNYCDKHGSALICSSP